MGLTHRSVKPEKPCHSLQSQIFTTTETAPGGQGTVGGVSHKHPVKGVVSMKEIQRGSLFTDNRVMTTNGIIEGTSEPDSGLRSFKGIPFAAPPVGDLRWKPPQPVENWPGVRKANQFGPRCMQRPIFGDMGFRSNGMSEDCLYLNVWTPAKSGNQRLPGLVYFFCGG